VGPDGDDLDRSRKPTVRQLQNRVFAGGLNGFMKVGATYKLLPPQESLISSRSIKRKFMYDNLQAESPLAVKIYWANFILVHKGLVCPCFARIIVQSLFSEYENDSGWTLSYHGYSFLTERGG
jgi:hypothetical protein